MKRYNEYDDDTLASMSEEELSLLIDLECAFNGVVFAPHPGSVPEKPIVKDTLSYFTVGTSELLFATQNEAEKVKSMVVAIKSTSYSIPGYYDFADKEGINNTYSVEVKSVRLPTEQALQQLRDEITTWKAADTRYKEQKQIWDKYNTERTKCHDTVMEAYEDAVTRVNNRQHMADCWAKYLVLADNNVDIAKNFFVNAFGEDNLKFVELS